MKYNKRSNKKKLPFLVFADANGKIHSHPYLRMAVSRLEDFFLPEKEDLIPLPRGSSLFYLPYRYPVGFNLQKGSFEVFRRYEGKEVFAVAAFLIPAYLRLYNPAYRAKNQKTMPLWAYTSCGFYGGKFFVTASRVDSRIRQSPRFYDNRLIKKQVNLFCKNFPNNRLYRHLANCALNYNCLAAKNLFLKRWEAPLPVSKNCNARCLGCLSFQDSDCVASHERIKFTPSREEIYQVMYNHLKQAREPIVSFGQGCEGEPILEAKLISSAIAQVRQVLSRGTINMNTNASIPKNTEILCRAGIDSFRVSVNSLRKKFYDFYFKPQGYKFKDVLESIRIAKKYNKFVGINLLVFPGFTDQEKEVKSLFKFIENTGIDMIQFRNLNIDPYLYIKELKLKETFCRGMLNLVEEIKSKYPGLKTGYFNLPKEMFFNQKEV